MNDQVTLSAYADEIRNLIHNDRNDEALALCRHILCYYPKHVETYRQMAEASLEKGDLESARELFRRVLSADPENVVAYAGLAIVFERQHLIDEALWHLERAYELAPTDPEIRKELLRLYGEVDGKPRARLKLTPGALARLYVQEGWLPQAIQEFRALAESEPARWDARIALAEMLWRAGRVREAAEVAQGLLEPLPYCLKANLILGLVWHESGLKESETYLHRAQALDPTNQIGWQLFGARFPLRPVQALVPRYVEGARPTPVPEPSAEPEPEWFTPSPLAPEAAVAEAPAPAPAAEMAEGVVAPPTETVPAAIAPTPEVEIPSPAPAPPIAAPRKPAFGDSGLPPWLRADFHAAALRQTQEAQRPPKPLVKPTTPISSALPPWLTELQKTLSEGITEKGKAPAEKVAIPVTPLPAWLTEQPQTEPGAPAPVEPTVPTEKPAAPREVPEVPEWLREPPTEVAPAVEIAPPEAAATAAAPAPPVEITRAEPEPKVAEAPHEMPVQEAPQEQPDWLHQAQFIPAPTEEAAAPPEVIQPVEAPVAAIPQEAAPPVEPAVAEVSLPAAAIPPAAPVESAAPIVVELPPPPEPVSVPAEPKRKRQPKGYEHLVQAREHRDANRLDDALVEYDYVVQHAPRLVGEVVGDLEELVQRAGIPLDAHRILGDAYTRADRLADALERYRFVLDRVS